MKGAGRGFTILLGAAGAGALVYVASRISGDSDWRYWAALGIVAGAGLLLALALRAGSGTRPAAGAPGLLFALVCVSIVVAWIAIAGQPHGNWFRSHVLSWSGDIGVRDVVEQLLTSVSVLAFGLGILFGSAPGAPRRAVVETSGPAPVEAVVAEPAAAATVEEPAADLVAHDDSQTTVVPP